ncbi:hypothetical protein MmTuc01_2034 [Methanosarcina mazei Tuc01]|uniref:Uncharacterized protein n=1 Tax=Methanosarcina mazei Tuc01 TaxID=1236903 RepID=M1PYF9_METMZ|nr:hypothetical protein MmTuc01_2034 [Methanosarcina mazei Tuc01]
MLFYNGRKIKDVNEKAPFYAISPKKCVTGCIINSFLKINIYI